MDVKSVLRKIRRRVYCDNKGGRMSNGEQIDLVSLFKKVSKSVKQNRDSLNQADTYNHDHGDNMVEIFDVITKAMKEKKNAEPADQLEYAAQLLREKSKSGSGKLYANNLESAAKKLTGKELDISSILIILQTLMGASQKTEGEKSGNLMGSLLGQLTGGEEGASGRGIDLGDLLHMGMDLLSSAQGGESGLDALAGKILSGSQMAESDYRSKSGEIVTKTLLEALGSMMKK